jgi:hypothetical protein
MSVRIAACARPVQSFPDLAALAGQAGRAGA